MLQAVMKDRSALYNPGRDLAHNADFYFQTVAERLEDGAWPILLKLCEDADVTMEDLGEACRVYIVTLASAHKVDETLEDRLKEKGWFDLPEVAQVAIMATIGTVTLGLQYNGIRERLAGGETTPGQDDAEILKGAKAAAAAIAKAGT